MDNYRLILDYLIWEKISTSLDFPITGSTIVFSIGGIPEEDAKLMTWDTIELTFGLGWIIMTMRSSIDDVDREVWRVLDDEDFPKSMEFVNLQKTIGINESIPMNHFSLDTDDRVQWFMAPYEDTVLVKTIKPNIFIEEIGLWHVILSPIITHDGWTWFRIVPTEHPDWILFRWQLDRMLINICNFYTEA